MGTLHPIDLELPNILYAQEFPYHLLSDDLLWCNNIFVDSSLCIIYMPASIDQNPNAEYRLDDFLIQNDTQKPDMAFHYNTRRPILRVFPFSTRKNWSWNGANHMALALLDTKMQPNIYFKPIDAPPNRLYISDGTFSTSVVLGVDDWTMKGIAMNKELYDDLHIDIHKCKGLKRKNHGWCMVIVPGTQDSKNMQNL